MGQNLTCAVYLTLLRFTLKGIPQIHDTSRVSKRAFVRSRMCPASTESILAVECY